MNVLMSNEISTKKGMRTRCAGRFNMAVARRVVTSSLALGLALGVLINTTAPDVAGAATSKDKALFVAVSNSYSATVTEFNIVIESFTPCTATPCIAAAIEGPGDTRFYQATVALEKKAPYPSGISKDVLEYVGNLVTIQKDINAVAKAKTIAKQQSIVSGTMETDVDDLAFRGMHILIYLGEQKKF
jgi:hypothetical protein